MDLEKLRREEKELEAQMYGTKDEEVVVEQTALPVEEEKEESTPVEVITQPEPVVKDKSSWKKRYTNYKASTDNTIRQLRTDNAALRVEVSEARARIMQLSKDLVALDVPKEDSFEDVFTKEDEDLIGVEAVDIIKKAMKSRKVDDGSSKKVEMLEARLAEMEAQRAAQAKQDLENLQADSMEDLKAKLSNIVEDWSVIDLEEDFGKYLKEVDPFSGVLRSTLFTRAIHDRDVKRVSDFYTDYKALKPKSREEILSAKVTPKASGASSAGSTNGNTGKRIYTIEEYTKFMDDFARGKYPGTKQEAEAKERMFDEAWMDNRVR